MTQIGRKDRRKEGRKEGRKDGRKEGRKEGKYGTSGGVESRWIGGPGKHFLYPSAY